MSYGTLDQFRIGEVIHNMDFDENPDIQESQEEVEVLKKILRRYKKNT